MTETDWNSELIDATVRSDEKRVLTALANGADIDTVCDSGFHQSRTPLIIAGDGCLIDCLNALIGHGAALEKPDGFGNTALGFAASGYTSKAVELLVKAGANVDTQNVTGCTPLMRVKEGAAAKCLLDADADITLKSNAGTTAIEYAARNEHADVLSLLLEAVNEKGLQKQMAPHVEAALEEVKEMKDKDLGFEFEWQKTLPQLENWLTDYKVIHLREENNKNIRDKQSGLRQYLQRKPNTPGHSRP